MLHDVTIYHYIAYYTENLANYTENFDLTIDGIALQQVHEGLRSQNPQNTCLGLKIDENLTWKGDVQNIKNKIIKNKIITNLRVMKKAKPYLNRQLLINIYYTIVKPHFDYCSTVWECIDMTVADQLQKLQNRAARIIAGGS